MKKPKELWMTVDDQDEAVALLWDAVRALGADHPIAVKIQEWNAEIEQNMAAMIRQLEVPGRGALLDEPVRRTEEERFCPVCGRPAFLARDGWRCAEHGLL